MAVSKDQATLPEDWELRLHLPIGEVETECRIAWFQEAAAFWGYYAGDEADDFLLAVFDSYVMWHGPRA